MDADADGGNAFPIQLADGTLLPGLTVRDYFAARAMQGLIAAAGYAGTVDYDEDTLAESAFLMADAMLRERNI